MKRVVLAAALLLSCAGRPIQPGAQAVGAGPADQAEPTAGPAPVERTAPREHARRNVPPEEIEIARRAEAMGEPRGWPPERRDSVRTECQERMGQVGFCDCFTTKLEAIAPNPDRDLTRSDIEAGLEACESTPADSTETSG